MLLDIKIRGKDRAWNDTLLFAIFLSCLLIMLLNFKDTEKSSLNQSICVYQIKCVPKTNSLTHYYAFKLLYTKGKEWHSEVISKYVILTNCSYYHYYRTKLGSVDVIRSRYYKILLTLYKL